MSSAKAALESDTRLKTIISQPYEWIALICTPISDLEVLSFEAGMRHKIRFNTISAGPLGSRVAKAIGFIDTMISYSFANAQLQKELQADEVGNAAAFLVSPLASAITGTVIYVDNGLHAMGVAVDSPVFAELNISKDKH